MGKGHPKQVYICETQELFPSIEIAAKELGYNNLTFGRHLSGKTPLLGLNHLHFVVIKDGIEYCLHCGALITEVNIAVLGKYKRICKSCYSNQRKIKNRRVKNKFANSHYPSDVIAEIWRRQDGKCTICNVTLDLEKAHIDHIIPLSKGGETKKGNLQFLCEMCNRGKFNWVQVDYIKHCKKVAGVHCDRRI